MNASTEVCRQILADIAAMEPLHMPMLFAEFNQDDIYIFNAATKQFVSQAGSSSETVRDANRFGYPVKAGQTWAKGMTAAHLGLWRKA